MAGKETSAEDSYLLGRGLVASGRLYIQHWIWNCSLGYLLYPGIPQTEKGLRIADIGAGNGSWLLELARHVPSNSQLEGFDVSSKQYPANEYLPSNVSLRSFDCFGEIPTDLVGVFDVVHVRVFAAVIRDGDPSLLLRNIVSMLKPGGYLQWDEFDLASISPHSSNPSISYASNMELIHRFRQFCAKPGLVFDWISNLPDYFKSNNFIVTDSFRLPISDDLRRAYTINEMLAMDEIASVDLKRKALDNSGRNQHRPFGTSEEFRNLMEAAEKEVSDGVTWSMDLVLCVGRKM